MNEHKAPELFTPDPETCEHKWEPCIVAHGPGKMCSLCGSWTTISKYEFRGLTGRSFWRVQKEIEDAKTEAVWVGAKRYSGYMQNKRFWDSFSRSAGRAFSR